MCDETPMMKVRVDGQIVERPVDFIDGHNFREEPMTEENELVLWAMGDPIPTIVKKSR